MPLYQIKSKINSQTINTDLEANSKDDALNFYNAVSLGEVLEIKEYLYTNPSHLKTTDDKKLNYASVHLFLKNTPPLYFKIPSLKPNVDEQKIVSTFRNLYRNIEKIQVSITLKK